LFRFRLPLLFLFLPWSVLTAQNNAAILPENGVLAQATLFFQGLGHSLAQCLKGLFLGLVSLHHSSALASNQSIMSE